MATHLLPVGEAEEDNQYFYQTETSEIVLLSYRGPS